APRAAWTGGGRVANARLLGLQSPRRARCASGAHPRVTRPRAPPGPDALAGSRNGAGPWRVGMRVALRLLTVLVASLVVASAWGQLSPAVPPAGSDVLETLRPGGHVVVFRHGATHLDQADTDPLNFDNVTAQRQLNDKGRADAQAVGDALRAAGVKFGKAYSSRFFRAVET